jgi:putative tryptophan/tyrosine transport system substrate-binding protein
LAFCTMDRLVRFQAKSRTFGEDWLKVAMSTNRKLTPVRLPPGWARLVTSSSLTGSVPVMIELHAKRLELLSELIPHARIIALLVNPNFDLEPIERDVQSAVRARGLQLNILKAGTAAEIDVAFATLGRQHADGLFVASDPFFDSRHEQIVALASSHAIPAIYPWRLYVAAVGLISYGPNLTAITRQLGIHTAKILKGSKPAGLPVEQPTKFEMVVNL